MTERLYYTDPYVREFDARIVERTTHEGMPAVTLDRTAFYPTSGGQPYDVGMLSGVRVLDVVELEDGRMLHVVEKLPESEPVRGAIDWERRFDHMQQHTGQHVLSAAFDRVLNARTESFHLGSENCTIDLGRELSGGDVAQAEQEANRVVWEDRPVTIRFASAEEAATLGLRKESRREGTLRLIDVQDFDLSACGGTHVARTGAIGTIVVSATERFRGGLRVTFLCGARALAGFRALRDAVAGSVRMLSVLPAELPSAIERLQAESREQRHQIKDLQLQLAVHEADALAASAVAAGAQRIVTAALPGDAAVLKIIAARIVERSGYVAVLVGGPPASPIVVARAADASVDASAVLKQLVLRHGGKGGGRPELAQGGGLTSPAADVLQSARGILAP